jgi:hypothetical protein
MTARCGYGTRYRPAKLRAAGIGLQFLTGELLVWRFGQLEDAVQPPSGAPELDG